MKTILTYKLTFGVELDLSNSNMVLDRLLDWMYLTP